MIHHKKSIDLRRMSEKDKRNFAVSITDDIRRAHGVASEREPGAEFLVYCSHSLWAFLDEYAADRCSTLYNTKCSEMRICGIETVITELPYDAWHLASFGERDHAEMLMFYSPEKEGEE